MKRCELLPSTIFRIHMFSLFAAASCPSSLAAQLWQIWVRNYQILEEAPATAKEAAEARKATGSDRPTSLVEIGPRFVLNPIRIFRGSFGGQTLYQNPEYVNPNLVRAEQRREKGFSYEKRKGSERLRKKRKEDLVVPADPLDNVFK